MRQYKNIDISIPVQEWDGWTPTIEDAVRLVEESMYTRNLPPGTSSMWDRVAREYMYDRMKGDDTTTFYRNDLRMFIGPTEDANERHYVGFGIDPGMKKFRPLGLSLGTYFHIEMKWSGSDFRPEITKNVIANGHIHASKRVLNFKTQMPNVTGTLVLTQFSQFGPTSGSWHCGNGSRIVLYEEDIDRSTEIRLETVNALLPGFSLDLNKPEIISDTDLAMLFGISQCQK